MNPGCLQQFIRRKRWRKRRLFCAFALFWRGICRRSGTQKRERRCRSLFSRLKLQFQTNIPLSTRAFQAHLTAVCIKTHAHVAGFYEAVALCPYSAAVRRLNESYCGTPQYSISCAPAAQRLFRQAMKIAALRQFSVCMRGRAAGRRARAQGVPTHRRETCPAGRGDPERLVRAGKDMRYQYQYVSVGFGGGTGK